MFRFLSGDSVSIETLGFVKYHRQPINQPAKPIISVITKGTTSPHITISFAEKASTWTSFSNNLNNFFIILLV